MARGPLDARAIGRPILCVSTWNQAKPCLCVQGKASWPDGHVPFFARAAVQQAVIEPANCKSKLRQEVDNKLPVDRESRDTYMLF